MKKRLVKFAGVVAALIVVLVGCSPLSENVTLNGEFTVGLECGYAPYNWTQSTPSDTAVDIGAGQYCDGYDVQIAKKIAQSMGRELVIEKMSWDGLILSVQSGQIDAIIAGMSPTAERKQEIDFSSPYYLGEFGVMVKEGSKFQAGKSVDDFKDMVISAQLGTHHVELIKQLNGVKALDPMKDFPTMTVALKSGELDGFVTERTTGLALENSNPELVYVPLLEENGGFKINEADAAVSVGMKKGSPLLKEVNQALAEISAEERDTLMDAAINQEAGSETTFLGDVWNILKNNYPAFISGTLTTLLISLSATFFGFFLGLLVSIVRDNKVGGFISNIYIGLFRGTPMMVQSMLFFYGIALAIPGFKWSNIPYGNLLAGILIVTINTGAYMAETIRSGIQALDKGQFEAAKSLGFTRWQTMTTIILPQAIKNIIPAIGNELIVNIKDTSVLNVIMVSELFFVSSTIGASTYKIFQTFLITSVIYLSLTTICSLILRRVERNLDNSNRKMKTSFPASQTHSSQIVQVKK